MAEDESPQTFPPGELTAAEIMQTMLPLVIQAAVRSASAATAAAEQGRSVELTLSTFKADIQSSIELNTSAMSRLATAKEEENKLLDTKNKLLGKATKDSTSNTKQWHETLRASLTSPVALQLIQLIVVLATAVGIVSNLPTNALPPATVLQAEQTAPGGGRP